MITYKRIEKGTEFYSEEHCVAKLIGLKGYSDDIFEIGDGVYKLERKGAKIGSMEVTLITEYSADYFIVPGVNYNGNGFGTFCEYLSDRCNGIPWVYGWERSSVPAMTMSQGIISERCVSCALFGMANDNESLLQRTDVSNWFGTKEMLGGITEKAMPLDLGESSDIRAR